MGLMFMLGQEEGDRWSESIFNSDMLLAVGLLFIIMALFSMIRKRKRRSAARLTPHEQIEQIQQHRGMRGDLEDLMVEIEQLAKRMGAQLDNKSVTLEKLIREADSRIAELKRLEGGYGGNGGSVEAGGGVVEDDTVSWPDDPVARRIYELADGGKSAEDIAGEVEEHIGKVELILALRRH